MNPLLRASFRTLKFGLRNIPTVQSDNARSVLQSALNVVNPLVHNVCHALPVAYKRRKEATVERFEWDISEGRSWAHAAVSVNKVAPSLPPLDPTMPVALRGDMVMPVDRNALRGTMLYLHGGAFICGSPATHRVLAVRLAVECGLRVFVPDYALAPRWRWPCPLLDALGAVWHLNNNDDSEASGFGPQPLLLGGDSAGGGLAAATALGCVLTDVPLHAVVMLSPWLDLTGTSPTMKSDDDMLPGERIPELVQCILPRGQDPRHPLASPCFASDSLLGALPPLYLAVGSEEILRGEGEKLMARRAQLAGCKSAADVLEIGDRLPHVWPVWAPVMSAGQETVLNIARWLRGLS